MMRKENIAACDRRTLPHELDSRCTYMAPYSLIAHIYSEVGKGTEVQLTIRFSLTCRIYEA